MEKKMGLKFKALGVNGAFQSCQYNSGDGCQESTFEALSEGEARAK